jgi:hypothetical protein
MSTTLAESNLSSTPAVATYGIGDRVSLQTINIGLEYGLITRIQGTTARIAIESGAKRDRQLKDLTPECDAARLRKALPDFGINERFDFLTETVELVAKNYAPSCLITGSGGLGKTFTTLEAITAAGLEEGDFRIIKGNSTAKGLYDALEEYNGELILFDDCDSILEDKVSRNILKGALDSYDKRIISWNNGQGLSSFEFTGRVIFISNKSLADINQALKTRCLIVDVSMTIPDILERMRYILPQLDVGAPPALREECLELITEYAYNIQELSLRTLRNTINCAHLNGEGSADWKRLAVYHMLNTSIAASK